MNTSMNLFADPIDRDAQRVSHDTAAARGRRPALLARTARRGWTEVLRQWHLQQRLHGRSLQI